MTKSELRQSILKRLRSISDDERRKKSTIISHKLFDSAVYKESNCLFIYASMDDEVDTTLIINDALRLGKRVGLPVTNPSLNQIKPFAIQSFDDCEYGPYGIRQPKNDCDELQITDLDLICVPGIAFDHQGYRLGRGGGYYDRFLSQIPSHIQTIGIAFDVQVVPSLPQIESHDIPISSLVTETKYRDQFN